MQLQSILSQVAGCRQIAYPKVPDAPGAHRKPRRIEGETALQLQFNWEIITCLDRFHAPGADRKPRRQRVGHGRRGRRVCARVQPLQPRLPRRCQGGRVDALHQPPVPHAGQQLRRRGVLGCYRKVNGFRYHAACRAAAAQHGMPRCHPVAMPAAAAGLMLFCGLRSHEICVCCALKALKSAAGHCQQLGRPGGPPPRACCSTRSMSKCSVKCRYDNI